MNPHSIDLAVLGSAALLAATGAFYLWLSRINQFFFFSRTVPEIFRTTPEAKEIETHYCRGICRGILASCLVYFSLYYTVHLSWTAAMMFGLLVIGLTYSIAFAQAHRATGQALDAWHKTQSAEPIAEAAEPQRSIAVPLLAPKPGPAALISLLAAVVVAAASWPLAMAASHMNLDQFNLALENAGSDFLSGLGIGLLAASFLLYVQLRFYSRSRSPLARFTDRTCLLLGWIGAAAIVASVLVVPMHWVITKPIHQGILYCVLAVALLRLLYGWLRARVFTPPMAEVNGDEYWRWGLFYANASDPALFLQRRSGPGYTLNYGNFFAWPLTLFLVADVVFLFVINLLHSA
jgi:hypothetical protein